MARGIFQFRQIKGSWQEAKFNYTLISNTFGAVPWHPIQIKQQQLHAPGVSYQFSEPSGLSELGKTLWTQALVHAHTVSRDALLELTEAGVYHPYIVNWQEDPLRTQVRLLLACDGSDNPVDFNK